MRAVKAVGVAVFVDILGPVGKIVGVHLPQLKRVLGLGQMLVVQFDIGGMVTGVKTGSARIDKNPDPALTDQGALLVQAETVRQGLVAYQDRVGRGQVGVVGLVGNAEDANIGLPGHGQHLLLVQLVQGSLVDLGDVSGKDRHQFGRLGGVEDRFEGKDTASLGGQRPVDDRPDFSHQLLERRALGVHDRLAAGRPKRPVVMANRAIGTQANRHRLPAAVKRQAGDVDVKDLVGVQDRPVDLDLDAAVGFAQADQVVGVFGVVTQQAARPEGVGNLRPEDGSQLARRPFAVQGVGADQGDVVALDTGLVEFLEQNRNSQSPKIGGFHRHLGDHGIVKGNRDL